MSGYQVTTPSWFAVQSPSQILQAQVEFLQAQYLRPQAVVVTQTAAFTLAAATGFLGQFVALTGTQGAGFNITTDTAANIIAALNTVIETTNGSSTIVSSAPLDSVFRTANNKVTPGFNVPVTIWNRATTQTGTVVAGSGVTVQGTATIATATIGKFLLTVTSDTTVSLIRLN
jgi:hypothetical protein